MVTKISSKNYRNENYNCWYYYWFDWVDFDKASIYQDGHLRRGRGRA